YGSPYLAPVEVGSMAEAEERMLRGKVGGIVRVPVDFSRRLASGDARVQLILNGVDANTAQAIQAYVAGALAGHALARADRAGAPRASGRVELVQRMWFNEAGISTWYLVPGLIVLVMTLIGA